MDSMVDQMTNKSSQPQAQPAAAPAQPNPPAQPSAPTQGGLDSMVDQMTQKPPQPTTTAQAAQTSANNNNSDAAKELAQKQAIAKHGVLHRAWDWVNQPIFDNVLPEGMKTSDIIKATAFERLYNEAYIPGVNDFDTKAETHFGGGKGQKPTDSATKTAIKTFLAGSAKDASDMAASFTSPLSVGTMMLGPASKMAGAAGTVAKVAAPLVGTAFGLQGAIQGAQGAADIVQHGMTPENTQAALGGAAQAALGATAPLHATGGVIEAGQRAAVPKMETIGGQEVPVRAEGRFAEAVQKGAPAEVNQQAARNTAAAVGEGVGNVVKNAVGTEAETKVGQQDRLGVRAHANELETSATTAMDELNRLSNGMYNEARDMEANSRTDNSEEGRAKNRAGKGLMKDIEDQYRDQMAGQGHDVDTMRREYRQSIALNEIATKLETATSPREGKPGEFDLSGKKLAKAIDDLRKVPGNENPSLSDNKFERAGISETHIQALSELADVLREQEKLPKFGGLTKMAAKALSVAAFGHAIGGIDIGNALTAVTGESVAEQLASKTMGKLFGEALTSEPAARELAAAIKGGTASLSNWDKFKATAAQLWQQEHGQAEVPGTGSTGNVGKPTEPAPKVNSKGEPLTPISKEAHPEYKMSTRDNGDLVMQYPNSESHIVFHPEPDTRPGFEGKTQLRQTGISAVDSPGAGQKMMDEAVLRLENSSKYSRIVADYPDRRSPDNERSWQRLKDRGHNVQVEPSTDSFRDPWDEQNNLEHTSLNAGEGGKGYSIPTATEAGAQDTVGHNPQSEISTREMTTGSEKKGTFQRTPNNPKDVTGWDAIEQAEKAKPGYMRNLLDHVLSYKDNGLKLTPEEIADPRKGLQVVINHWADNLTWLHDSMPPELREIAKKWYDSAHKMANDIATKNNTTPEKVAGVIAMLSPQNPWDLNVGQADRLIDMYQNSRNHPFTQEMDEVITRRKARALKGKDPDIEFANKLENLRGKTWDQLNGNRYDQALWMRMLDEAHGNPQTPVYAPDGQIRSYQKFNWGLVDTMVKGIELMEGDGSPQSIHEVIGEGHKIRNFYNNIISPNSVEGHATIDTHHVNADMLKPMSSKNDIEVKRNFGGSPEVGAVGVKGTYSLHHAALRQAAESRGILPREMQSITWERIKTLMGDEKKTPELRKAVTEIWQAHQRGELTINEARDRIVKAAGGFDKPGWAKERDANGKLTKSDTGSDEGSGSTADTKELPVLAVHGEPTVGSRPGSGGNVPTPVPNPGTGADDAFKAVRNAKQVKPKTGKGAAPAGRKRLL